MLLEVSFMNDMHLLNVNLTFLSIQPLYVMFTFDSTYITGIPTALFPSASL